MLRDLCPLRRGRTWLLALGCLIGSLLGGPTRAGSYYDDNLTYHLGTGATKVGRGVDLATGAYTFSMSLGSVKSPARVPVVGGFTFTSQDASTGPLGPGTSLFCDYFIYGSLTYGGITLIAP